MRHTTKLLLLFLFVCASFASEARAENFVITSGSVSAIQAGGFGYVFQGNGFHTAGRRADINSYIFRNFAYQSGSTVNLGAYMSGGSGNGWSFIINGVTYNPFSTSAVLQFSGSTILPNIDAARLTFTAPFTLDGWILGRDSSGVPLFDVTLSGQGLAIMEAVGYLDSTGRRIYDFQRITYNFHAQPTPEPATMLLLGTGIAGVAGAVRRRRRNAIAEDDAV